MGDPGVGARCTGLSPANGLAVLARIAQRTGEGRGILGRLVARHLPHLAEEIVQACIDNGPVVAEALRAAAEDCQDPATLDDLYGSLPVFTTVLGETALQVTVKRLSVQKLMPETLRIATEINLAVRLRNMVRLDEAAKVTERTVATCRENTDWTGFLAMALLNQGTIEAERGNAESALRATEECVAIYTRRLDEAEHDVVLSLSLASALSNLGARLASLERHEEALAAQDQAREIQESLLDADPDGAVVGLATTLVNTANTLRDLGRFDDAALRSREAVELYRRLADAVADAFEPGLARAALNHAGLCRAMGSKEDAISYGRMGTDIWRRLAGLSIHAHGSSLRGSLNNLALFLEEGDHLDEAIRTVDEELALLPQLHGISDEERRHRIALKKIQISGLLRKTRRYDAALSAAAESLALAEQYDDTDEGLEYRLHAQFAVAGCLAESGRGAEAVDLLRELTGDFEEELGELYDDFGPVIVGAYRLLADLAFGKGDLDVASRAALNAGLLARDMLDGDVPEEAALLQEVTALVCKTMEADGDAEAAALIRDRGLASLVLADD